MKKTNKKIALAPVKGIQAPTGYIRGGCSPVGMKKDYPVYIDDSATAFETVYINAGARGLLMQLRPGDLLAVTGGTLGEISE